MQDHNTILTLFWFTYWHLVTCSLLISGRKDNVICIWCSCLKRCVNWSRVNMAEHLTRISDEQGWLHMVRMKLNIHSYMDWLQYEHWARVIFSFLILLTKNRVDSQSGFSLVWLWSEHSAIILPRQIIHTKATLFYILVNI